MARHLLVEHREVAAFITINRPEKRNAISHEMWLELAMIFERISIDPSVDVVVIRGAGTDFSAGGDLNNLDDVYDRPAAERVAIMRDIMTRETTPMFLALDRLPQPVICSIRGHIIGASVQFAMMADLVLASETARFWLPFVGIAQTTCHGESYSFPRKIGLSRALQLTLLSEPFGASDAERYGIVNWVTTDAELEDRTEAVLRKLLEAPRTSTLATKALLRTRSASDAEECFQAEAKRMLECVASENFSEAIRAFKAKRSPRYSRA